MLKPSTIDTLNLAVPVAVTGVDGNLLKQSTLGAIKALYAEYARKLAEAFTKKLR